MSSELVQTRPLVKASSELSTFLGMEVSAMIDAIKSQCFKGKRADEVTDAQLATYISVANALKLNPLLPGMMYPYPDRNGSVTVMIGPDGVYTLLANNPDIVAQKDGGPAWWTEHGTDVAGKETCTGYINHRTKGLLKKTIWVDEWVVASNPNWNTRRHHQSEIRALKQAARMVIHGLPFDSDEVAIMGEINVTPAAEPEAPARPAAPKRSPKGAAAVQENPKPADKPIEAEIVQPKAEVPPPAKEAPKAAPAPVVEDPAPKAPEPRTSLNDGEVLETTCKVDSVQSLMVKSGGELKASVMAEVSGGFTGSVMHIGGGEVPDGEKDPVPLPVWRGNVHLTLRGRLNKASGRMLVMVDKITEAQSATPTVSVE